MSWIALEDFVSEWTMRLHAALAAELSILWPLSFSFQYMSIPTFCYREQVIADYDIPTLCQPDSPEVKHSTPKIKPFASVVMGKAWAALLESHLILT